MRIPQLILYISIFSFLHSGVVAQWEKLCGPFIGTINFISSEDTALYIGVNSSIYTSIYKLSGNDKTLEFISGAAGKTTTAFISLDSHRYIGTDEGVMHSYFYSDRWHLDYAGLDGVEITSFLSIGSIIYAGTEFGGVYSTSNYGFTWIAMNQGLSEKQVRRLFRRDSTIYAVTASGVFISDDTCKTWKQEDAQFDVHGIVSCIFEKSILLIGTNDSGVFISFDAGKKWKMSNVGFNAEFIFSIAAKGNNIYLATEKGIFRSKDKGDSWERVFTGEYYYQPRVIGVFEDHVIFGGNKDGVFISTDEGGHWKQCNYDISNSTILSFSNYQGHILAGCDRGIMISKDTGSSWINVDSRLDDQSVHSTAIVGDKTIVGIYNDLYIYTNDFMESEIVKLPYNVRDVNDLTVSGNHLFFGTIGGLFMSIDTGKNWINVTEQEKIYDIQCVRIIDSVILLGTFTHGVYLSTDFGASWEEASKGLPLYSIVNSFARVDTLIFAVIQDEGIFKTNDFGRNWVSVNNGLKDKTAVSIVSYEDHLLLSTNTVRLYSSNNNGSYWSDITDNLPASVIYSKHPSWFTLCIADSLLLLCGGGVWRRPASELISPSSVWAGQEYVENITLYPNPVTDKLIIETEEWGTAVISDVSGNPIRTAVITERKNEIVVSELPSGVYFVTIRNMDGNVSTGRFIKM